MMFECKGPGTHAFQFAGYYAAREKGYYRDIGLDVYFREAAPGVDPTEQVIAGQAQYGVGTSSLLLARKAGKPVVVLAVIFQHSPLVLVVRQNRGATQTIHDLKGMRIMFEPQSDELTAYLEQEGIRLGGVSQRAHSFNIQDLIDGHVDAMSAYVTNEPYYLERAGIAHQVYTPRSVGIDFYGDNLFTSETELKVHPERVRAFREASLRGWEYAMAHQEEIAELILKKYSNQHPRDFYLYEAKKMVPLLRTDLVEPGYMTLGRWRHIANTYAELGLLPRNATLDGFLYEPDSVPNYGRIYGFVFGGFGILSLLIYIARLRHSLTKQRAMNAKAEEYIKEHAFFDAETGMPSRKLFEDRINTRLADMRRHKERGAMIFIRFPEAVANKNERVSGIQSSPILLAHWLKYNVRESDAVARLGDFEWAVLLARLDQEEFTARAQVQETVTRLVRGWGQSRASYKSNDSDSSSLKTEWVMLDANGDGASVLPHK